MHTYECESCGQFVEIEEIEAIMHPPEHYEHGQCKPCFEKSC
jgi:hypothetical protein